MRDKLLKILKLRIDAINRNIDNLNYLNSELEKNTADLNYIQDKIDIFAANDILNFDSLSHDDFEKVLVMIDPSVADVFQDKTCNYQGIMYIIQGIRQGVSLELTSEQANAIRLLIQEMINKKASLEDIIANLNESKSKLPETEMAVLTNSLKNFQTIISKIEENLYVIEVEDIISSLEFANVPLEEKVGIFEFLLKYNTRIYLDNQKEVKEPVKEDEYSLKEINVPEFHYEPINIYNDEENDNDTKSVNKVKEEASFEEPSYDDKFGNLEATNQIPLTFPSYDEVAPENESFTDEHQEENKEEAKEEFNFEASLKNADDSSLEVDLPKFDVISPVKEVASELPKEIEIPSVGQEVTPVAPLAEPHEEETEPVGPETRELEDIIGKIDARLKEMESESKGITNPMPLESAKTPIDGPSQDINSILEHYGLSKDQINIENVSISDIEKTLAYLNETELLDILKEDSKVLSKVVTVKKDDLEKCFNIIKENFKDEEDNLQDLIEDIIATIPIILTSKEHIDNFSKNIDFMKEHNIDLSELLAKNRELLIIKNEILVNNYNKVKNYNIDLTNENIKYLLYNKNALRNIDYYIEAKGAEKGFLGKEEEFDGYDCIVNNPYKLNNINRTALLKLRYATENNHKIFSNKAGILSGEITNPKVDIIKLPDNYIDSYFNNEYQSISSSELERLMQEFKNLKEIDLRPSSIIETLDSKYKIDDLRYSINNLIFSRLKTISLYNFLTSKEIKEKDALLIALTYNSVIKKDEFANIEKTLEGGN